MKWSLMISNVQDRIDQEKISWQVNSPSSEMDVETSFLSYFMDWKSFQSEATILGWLKNVIENFCFYCETEIIGQTFEGRNMTIMKVGIIIPHCQASSPGPSPSPPRPNPNPKPKEVPKKKVELGLGLRLKSHKAHTHPPLTFNNEVVIYEQSAIMEKV